MAGAEPVSIGEQLRRYRMRAGLTQEELAERAGLSARAIRALETSASRAPRRDTLGLLVAALGLTPAERERLEATLRQRRMPAPLAIRPATAARGPRPPLVGREPERALLDAILRGEGPRLLLLAGEPGIGKSRLLERAAERAEELGWTVVAGGCTRRSAQEPYAPCVEALARLLSARGSAQLRMDLHGCGWLVRLLPELAEYTVGPAQSWTLPPQQERRLMFAAVARVLENVAGPAGTLLLLDDLHWAGVDALDLLAYLLREASGRRPWVVGAYRDTDVSPQDALPMLAGDLTREGLAAGIPLAPLPSDDAMRLLSALFAEASTGAEAKTETEDVRRDIVARAGGIPFFLVSCAQEAHGGELAERASLAEPFTVPRDAAESIRQRVAQLAEPARDVVTVMAVAGRQLRRAVLLPVVEGLGYHEGAVLVALEAAIRARLLEEHADGSYAFTHDLIRETVAADMSGARRAALHRRIAEAMEHLPAADQRVAELAWHFAQGDAPARALPYALRAGDQAEAMYAHSEAEGHYGAATELARQVDDRARAGEALEKRADVLYRLTRYREAYACLDEAIRRYRTDENWERLAWATAQIAKVGDPLNLTAASLVRLEELFRTLAAVATGHDTGHDTEGGPQPGENNLLEQQAARATSLLTPRAAARIYLCLTARLLFLGRYDEVYAPSESAIQHARAAGDPRMESLAYGFRADAQQARGQLDEAAASAARARACATTSGDPEALYMALRVEATIAERQAEPLRARETLLTMLEISTQVGDVGDEIDTLNGLALVAFALGDWDMAAGYFARSAELLRGDEADFWCSPAIGRAVLDAIRDERAGQNMSLSVTPVTLADTEGISDAPVGAWAIATLAELTTLDGRADDASARLRRAIARFETEASSANPLYAPLAWAEMECGELARAHETLARAHQLAGEQRDQAARVEIERIAALLALREGQWEEARQSVERALAICEAAPYPYAEAKARYVSGQVYAAMGWQAEAREEFARALASCARLGERCYRVHIERALISSRDGGGA